MTDNKSDTTAARAASFSDVTSHNASAHNVSTHNVSTHSMSTHSMSAHSMSARSVTASGVSAQSVPMRAEIFVAKAYMYLLPVRMITQLSFLSSYMRGAAVYFDVVLHMLGFALFAVRAIKDGGFTVRRDPTSKLLRYAFMLMAYLNLSSVVMAAVMQLTYGSHGGETAFSGIFGMLIYFTQYAFMFWYNREIFTFITVKETEKIIGRVVFMLLVLGWIQLAVILIGGSLSELFDRTDVFDIFITLKSNTKLSLTGSEGANAGTIIGVFVLPYLFSQLLRGRRIVFNITQLLLWLPVIYMTNSSTAYILAAVAALSFFAVLLVGIIKKYGAAYAVIIVTVVLLIILMLPDSLLEVIPQIIREQVEYLLLEKPTDLENGSTVSRTVTLVVNWGAFREYPIFGVGNGLQGYFYEKYFPDWAYEAKGSDVTVFLEKSRTGISNGGVFFPSILSGYGIVGTLFVVIFIVMGARELFRKKRTLGPFYYFALIAALPILFTGMQGNFNGGYLIFFVMSIPLMARDA